MYNYTRPTQDLAIYTYASTASGSGENAIRTDRVQWRAVIVICCLGP